LYLSRPARHR